MKIIETTEENREKLDLKIELRFSERTFSKIIYVSLLAERRKTSHTNNPMLRGDIFYSKHTASERAMKMKIFISDFRKTQNTNMML